MPFIKGQPSKFKGRKHSVETREKIKRNNTKYWLGKSHTEETKQKISKISKERSLSGELHPNWKGGITPIHIAIRNSEEARKWRKAVFGRDNYTCVECGTKGGYLVADHIKGFSAYPELRFDIDNGRTLCKDCNYETTYVTKDWKLSTVGHD
jgi:hypothetical protein